MNGRTSAALLAAAFMGWGCGGAGDGLGAPSGDASGTDSTLNGTLVLEQSAAGALTGRYTTGGTTLRFEARRGGANPEEAIRDGAPRYRVAARYLDAEGKTFLVQVSGHEDATLGWPEIEAASDPSARVTAARLVPQLARALETSALGDEVAPELEALIDLGYSLRNTELERTPRKSAGQLGACTAGYVHRLEVHRMSLTPFPRSEHSAVSVHSYYQDERCATTWLGTKSTCNHGTCAPRMALKCSWESGPLNPRQNAFPPLQGENRADACGTYYNPASSFGGHNCNDDTFFQVHNVIDNALYAAQVGPNDICRDGTSHYLSPGCDGRR